MKTAFEVKMERIREDIKTSSQEYEVQLLEKNSKFFSFLFFFFLNLNSLLILDLIETQKKDLRQMGIQLKNLTQEFDDYKTRAFHALQVIILLYIHKVI